MMGDNRWGPVGFTTIARCILWPYMTDTTTDVERFDGAPAAVAERAMLSLPVSAQQIQLEHDPPMDELVQLALTLPDAHLHGYIVAPTRDDERLHFILSVGSRDQNRYRSCWLPTGQRRSTPDDGWIHVWWH